MLMYQDTIDKRVREHEVHFIVISGINLSSGFLSFSFLAPMLLIISKLKISTLSNVQGDPPAIVMLAEQSGKISNFILDV